MHEFCLIHFLVISTKCSIDRCSAGPHTTCVPPPEVPQGCGLKERGEGWTCPKTARGAQVDSVRSTGYWRQVCSGGKGAWGEGRGEGMRNTRGESVRRRNKNK